MTSPRKGEGGQTWGSDPRTWQVLGGTTPGHGQERGDSRRKLTKTESWNPGEKAICRGGSTAVACARKKASPAEKPRPWEAGLRGPWPKQVEGAEGAAARSHGLRRWRPRTTQSTETWWRKERKAWARGCGGRGGEQGRRGQEMDWGRAGRGGVQKGSFGLEGRLWGRLSGRTRRRWQRQILRRPPALALEARGKGS